MNTLSAPDIIFNKKVFCSNSWEESLQLGASAVNIGLTAVRSFFSSSFSCWASSLMAWCFPSNSSSARTCASLKRCISSS